MNKDTTSKQLAELRDQVDHLTGMVKVLLANHVAPEEMLTVAEAAALAKVSQKTILRWIHNRSIAYTRPSGKAKGRCLIPRAALVTTKQPVTRRRRGRKTKEVTAL